MFLANCKLMFMCWRTCRCLEKTNETETVIWAICAEQSSFCIVLVWFFSFSVFVHVHIFFCYYYHSVAVPAQQRSQVILRSEHPRARSPECTFFLKKIDDLFTTLKTQRPPMPLRLSHCQNKTNKAFSSQIQVEFLYSVRTITEAKQSNRQGGNQDSGSSSQTWRTLV